MKVLSAVLIVIASLICANYAYGDGEPVILAERGNVVMMEHTGNGIRCTQVLFLNDVEFQQYKAQQEQEIGRLVENITKYGMTAPKWETIYNKMKSTTHPLLLAVLHGIAKSEAARLDGLYSKYSSNIDLLKSMGIAQPTRDDALSAQYFLDTFGQELTNESVRYLKQTGARKPTFEQLGWMIAYTQQFGKEAIKVAAAVSRSSDQQRFEEVTIWASDLIERLGANGKSVAVNAIGVLTRNDLMGIAKPTKSDVERIAGLINKHGRGYVEAAVKTLKRDGLTPKTSRVQELAGQSWFIKLHKK